MLCFMYIFLNTRKYSEIKETKRNKDLTLQYYRKINNLIKWRACSVDNWHVYYIENCINICRLITYAIEHYNNFLEHANTFYALFVYIKYI